MEKLQRAKIPQRVENSADEVTSTCEQAGDFWIPLSIPMQNLSCPVRPLGVCVALAATR